MIANGHVHGRVEDLVDSAHLFAAALHVGRTHTLRYGSSLFGRHWRETLRLEEIDAGLLVTEIRLEAEEDDGRCRTEVEHFWIPL